MRARPQAPHRPVLYRERNTFRAAGRHALLREIKRLRRDLAAAPDDLGLEPTEQAATDDVWARCAAIRENLTELETRQLRRYGAVPRELGRYAYALSGPGRPRQPSTVQGPLKDPPPRASARRARR